MVICVAQLTKKSIYRQPPFYVDKPNFPITEETAKKIVSLPMHPYLSLEDIEKVSQALAV